VSTGALRVALLLPDVGGVWGKREPARWLAGGVVSASLCVCYSARFACRARARSDAAKRTTACRMFQSEAPVDERSPETLGRDPPSMGGAREAAWCKAGSRFERGRLAPAFRSVRAELLVACWSLLPSGSDPEASPDPSGAGDGSCCRESSSRCRRSSRLWIVHDSE